MSVNKYMDRDLRTHAIIGAAMEVHRIVGPGHLEAVYQECLEIELKLRDIPFISQPRLEIFYKEQKLKKGLLSFVWVNFHNSGKNAVNIFSFKYSRSLMP